MKKLFLTGFTSFLGSKFIKLYGKSFEIKGIARSYSPDPVDLTDFNALKRAYDSFQPDIIIHAAADVDRDYTTSDDILKTNPAITKKLIDLALPNNTPFVFTSSEAVYGGKEQKGEYVETDIYKARSPYG
jgi:dTDP-4-dehydrorhamnose reductase